MVNGLLNRIAAYYGITKKDLVHAVRLRGMMPLLDEMAEKPDLERLRDTARALAEEAVGGEDSEDGEGPG